MARYYRAYQLTNGKFAVALYDESRNMHYRKMTAEEYLSLGKMYPSPGYCDEIIHMYLAKGLHPSKQHLDEDEFLEVYKIPFETVLSEILSGQLTDAKTQIAVLKAARILGL